jgi:predicted PurR-regulated permease PerM
MSSIQKTFMLFLIAALLLVVYLLKPILTPFLVGMGLAYLGDPVVDRLERLGLGRTSSVLVVFAILFLVFGVAFFVVVPVLFREIGSLVRDIPSGITWLQDVASPHMLEIFGIDPFHINLDMVKDRIRENWDQAGGVMGRLLSELTASGYFLAALIANLALTPVVTFYMLRDWDGIVLKVREMIPRDSVDAVTGLLEECDEVLSAFLRGQMLIMILLGCIYALGLTLIGLKLAILIGLLAGLASIVPYLGFFVGIVAASIAAFFQFHDFVPLIYVAIVFAIGQAMEGMVLTPWLVGDRIGLHPVAVIFAVLAGGQLFGFIGVLLALPAAAVLMVFARHLHLKYVASEYYTEETIVEAAAVEGIDE